MHLSLCVDFAQGALSFEEGREEGREEGEQIGIAKGEQKKAEAIARNLLQAGMQVEGVSEATGLPVDVISSLNKDEKSR